MGEDETHRLLRPFLDDPGRAGVFTDFDGTLAPIVADPTTSRPLPGTAEALAAVAARYARAGVISGRPVHFLRQQLGEGLLLSGLYGLEVVEGGQEVEHPEARRWRPVVEAAADRVEAAGPAGMRVERKGLSLTLHFRVHPEVEGEVRSVAAAEAARSGLELRSAKASVELHPPLRVDKGTALAAVAEGLGAVCFLGDDVGDLPAFDALDDLARGGVSTLRVGVGTPETPPEVVARADLVVDGPPGALAVLRRLAAG